MADPPAETTMGEPGSLARRFWDAIARDQPAIAREIAGRIRAPAVGNAFPFDDEDEGEADGESKSDGGDDFEFVDGYSTAPDTPPATLNAWNDAGGGSGWSR